MTPPSSTDDDTDRASDPAADRPTGAFADAVARWHPDTSAAAAAASAARDRFAALATPPGALGRLEDLGVQLATIAGTCPPPVPSPAAVAVFAGDHGVHAAGVTPWPQEITAAMVGVMADRRAAINAFAATVGATVHPVDVGIATTDASTGAEHRVRPGTRNLAEEAAMTSVEAARALDVGVEVARRLIDDGARCLVTGEMGIGNTTAAAALIAALTGRRGADVAGRGAGTDDEGLARKVAAVDAGLGRHRPTDEPLAILASVGGLEIAALAGFIVGGVTARVPVIIDGVIADAALLVAERLAPGTVAGVIAGHRSTEPGAALVFEALAIEPLLDLGMRLGEGTGAVLAVPLLQAAARALTDVATIAEVTGG